MSLPVTATLSGGLLRARVAELGRDLVAALVAPVLGREHDRAGRRRRGGAVTGWTLNVKSPRSPWKPETSNVYVPAVVNVRLMNSGLVPVSIGCQDGAGRGP